jgi:hypothetical protein
LSLKDRFSIEVTIPRPWGGVENAKSLLLQAAAVNLIASATPRAGGEQDVASSDRHLEAEPGVRVSDDPVVDADPEFEATDDWDVETDPETSDRDTQDGTHKKSKEKLPPVSPLNGSWVFGASREEGWTVTDYKQRGHKPRT